MITDGEIYLHIAMFGYFVNFIVHLLEWHYIFSNKTKEHTLRFAQRLSMIPKTDLDKHSLFPFASVLHYIILRYQYARFKESNPKSDILDFYYYSRTKYENEQRKSD